MHGLSGAGCRTCIKHFRVLYVYRVFGGMLCVASVDLAGDTSLHGVQCWLGYQLGSIGVGACSFEGQRKVTGVRKGGLYQANLQGLVSDHLHLLCGRRYDAHHMEVSWRLVIIALVYKNTCGTQVLASDAAETFSFCQINFFLVERLTRMKWTGRRNACQRCQGA